MRGNAPDKKSRRDHQMSTKIYSLVWKNMMTPVRPKPEAPQKVWLCCNRG